MVLTQMVMKKDCILDFVDTWQAYDQTKSDIVRLGVNWNARFREAGYYSVELTKNAITNWWGDVHKWCGETFGKEHYTWVGETFWFETEQAAVWFALRWS